MFTIQFFFIILKQIRQAESKINFFTLGLNGDWVNIFVSIIHRSNTKLYKLTVRKITNEILGVKG